MNLENRIRKDVYKRQTEDRMLLIGEYEIEGKKLKSTEEISQIVDDIDIDYMKGLIDRLFSKPMACLLYTSRCV